jgi:FkbM family methyltransferase
MNIYQELLKIFNPKDAITIFDIGSNECEDSIRYSKTFPNARIFAFEPIKENYDKCVKNTAEYRNIKVYNCALGDSKHIDEMYVSSGCPEGRINDERHNWGNKSSSLLKPKEHLNIHPWCEFNEKQPVMVDRIDNICNFLHINDIDYCHIDVQGFELKVLNGAGDFINKIKCIYLEVEAIELYEGQPLKEDIEKFMDENGFVKIGDTVDHISGDQLYLNTK